jgi:Ca-activated chloride channel family protein
VRTVSFASPYLLLTLVVVPVLLAGAVWFDRRRAPYPVAFTNLEVLAAVVPKRRPWRAWVPLVLFLLALVAAATALARPRAVESVPSQRSTIVLLVDVSGSMRASDVKPSRLGAAQNAMDSFLDKIPRQVRVGLVSFSTEPDVLVLPTTDRELMHEGLDLLAPEAGTAIGDGLGAAIRVVKASIGNAVRGRDGKVPAAIVLLSDGAQTRGTLRPLEGAALARDAGIRVYTVALGTNNGTLGIGPFGGNYGFGTGGGGRRFPVRPDPATLRAIAEETGGVAYQAKSASKVQDIYRSLGSSVVTQPKQREISSWFTGAAAALLLGSLGFARLTGGRLP